jgi:hypothetical protein
MAKIAFNASTGVNSLLVNEPSSLDGSISIKPKVFWSSFPNNSTKRSKLPSVRSTAGRVNLSAQLQNGNSESKSCDEIPHRSVELPPTQTIKERPIVLRNSSRLVLDQGTDATCGIMACGMMLHTLGKPMSKETLLHFFEQELGPGIRENGVEFAYISIFLRILIEQLSSQFKIKTKYNSSVEDVVAATGFGYPAIVGLKLDENCYHVVVVDFPAIIDDQPCLAIRDSSGPDKKNQYFMTMKNFGSLFMGALIHAEKQIGC